MPTLMANFDCQLDYTWERLKPKHPNMLFLIVSSEVERATLNLGRTFWWQPT